MLGIFDDAPPPLSRPYERPITIRCRSTYMGNTQTIARPNAPYVPYAVRLRTILSSSSNSKQASKHKSNSSITSVSALPMVIIDVIISYMSSPSLLLCHTGTDAYRGIYVMDPSAAVANP